MTASVRLGLLATAASASLAFVSSALAAAYSPSLTVVQSINRQTAQSSTDITYGQSAGDDPLAKLQILSPQRIVTLTHPPGTKIGSVEGSLSGGMFGAVPVPVTGTIVAANSNDVDLQNAAEACTGVAAHDATWLLNLTAAGQSVSRPLPLFVDVLPVLYGGQVVDNATTASVELCLQPPSADSGNKLLELTLRVSGVFSFGKFTDPHWTAINTPYSGEGTVDQHGAIETQAIDEGPVDGSLSAKRLTKTRKVVHKRYTDIFYSYFGKLSGELTVGPEFAPQAHVDIRVGDKNVRSSITTNRSDYAASFSEMLKLSKTTTYHAVYAKVPQPLLGATCEPTLPLGTGAMPCGTIMGNGFTVRTEDVTLTKPKLSHKRIKHRTRNH